MEWNVAFRKVMEMKRAYEDRFGADTLFAHDCRTSLDHWAEELGSKEYCDILADLHRNERDGLVLLHYRLPHAIDGRDFYKAYDGLMSECRSVVIDLKNEELALVPFRKFRNLNECTETSADNVRERLRNAKIVEFSDKLDGSMQSARFYKGRLLMSGSKAIDREKSRRLDNGYRFVESHDNYMDMIRGHPDHTFVFEYIFEDDPHIVDYSGREKGLYLIGMRGVTSGRELHYYEVLSVAERYGVMTTVVDNTNMDDALEYLRNADGREKEGFVVNIDGFRVKLKSDDYVSLHTSIWNLQDDNVLIDTVKNGMLDDVLPKINEPLRSEIMKKAALVTEYIRDVELKVESYIDGFRRAGLSDKRDVMIWISENVPERYASMVRAKYLGKDVDYIKNVKAEEILGSPE